MRYLLILKVRGYFRLINNLLATLDCNSDCDNHTHISFIQNIVKVISQSIITRIRIRIGWSIGCWIGWIGCWIGWIGCWIGWIGCWIGGRIGWGWGWGCRIVGRIRWRIG